jgi:hypothetical protein
MKEGKQYVLKRKADGKYFSVFGWSVEWIDKPDHSCPKFNTHNKCDPYFHGAWLKKYRKTCELEEIK